MKKKSFNNLDYVIRANRRTCTCAAALLLVALQASADIKETIQPTTNVAHLVSKLEKPVSQQEKTVIKGTVTDEKGEPLPFVTICYKGTSFGCVSSIDGAYELVAPRETGLHIQVSSIGYVTQDILVNGRETINIVMKEDVMMLEETVIVGYGSVQKKDLTGSVATVKADDIALVKSQSVETALSGQIAGLNVTTATGKPGEGAKVQIRGVNSINGSNQPLYVVDGVPIVVDPAIGGRGNTNASNPLLTINPNNIERIDVLKDASAAAIYGSRAANGVVLITTKKGRQNQKPTVTFTASLAIQNNMNKYNLMDATEYKRFVTQQARAKWDASTVPEAVKPSALPTENDILNNPNYFSSANTDWQKEITNKNAAWQQYSVNITGGSTNTTYSLSASYDNQEGILIGNEFKRYNINMNIETEVNKWLKIGSLINYNHTTDNSSDVTSLLFGGNYRPDQPVYDEKGEGTSHFEYIRRAPVEFFNPVVGAGTSKNQTTSQNMYGNLFGEITFMKGLKFRSQLNVLTNNSERNDFDPSYNRGFYAMAWGDPGALLTKEYRKSWSSTFTNTLNYDNTINDIHTINAVVGAAWDQSSYEVNAHELITFPDDKYLTNQNSASTIRNNSSQHMVNGLNSFFARFNYVYDNRYLATLTMRSDGSTKFGPGNRYGFFPSGALAWNIHHEDFMKDIEQVSRLKLRASYGRTGSDNLPSFTYLPYYNSGSYYDNNLGLGVNGLDIAGVPNPDIRWESTDQLDLGLEFGLFDSRLTAEIVYFEKNTSDIILYVPVTGETGSSSWSTNVADVSNKGWEVAVGGDIFRGDFRWNSSVNFSFIKNKVEGMNGGTASEAGYSRGIIEGAPIGCVYGFTVDKIAQSKEEIDALNKAATGNNNEYFSGLKEAGDYIFKDMNGDGFISNDDKSVIGDINPDFYGGWNNQLSYKNFNLSCNFTFSKGAQKEWTTVTGLAYNELYDNSDRVVFDTWTKDNTDATYARYGSATHEGNAQATSKSIFDASYFKLQTLALSYDFRGAKLESLGLSNVRLSATANNVFMITNYPGLDPQSSGLYHATSATSTADDGYSYPNVRTFSLALNVTF